MRVDASTGVVNVVIRTRAGSGGEHWWLARRAMHIYNQNGILSNTEDSLTDLRAALAAAFDDYEVEVHGSVAVYTATRG